MAEKEAAAVVAEAQAAVAAPVKESEFFTGDRVELTTEEKYTVSKLENEFLRANSEITRLQGVAKGAQETFPKIVSQLVAKYKINPVTHVFDNINLIFAKKQ